MNIAIHDVCLTGNSQAVDSKQQLWLLASIHSTQELLRVSSASHEPSLLNMEPSVAHVSNFKRPKGSKLIPNMSWNGE